MAVRIRLKRIGTRKRPFYRIVVMDSRTAPNGRPIEEIGHSSAVLPVKDQVHIMHDRVDYWCSKGAKVSETVRRLIKRAPRDNATTTENRMD